MISKKDFQFWCYRKDTQIAFFFASAFLFFPRPTILILLHSQSIQTPNDAFGNEESHLGLLNVGQFKICSCVYFQMYFACEKNMNFAGVEGRMLGWMIFLPNLFVEVPDPSTLGGSHTWR